MSEDKIKYFDMFAGIGGFRTGLANAGDIFLPVGWCEIDRFAQKAYRTLYDTGGEYYCSDATKIDTDELPEIDLICGGFPCQPFSFSGRRLGFNDTRGTLFHEIVRVAQARHLKYLLLENVPGLLNHDGGKTFGTILETIHELGYGLEWCVLNSADFGVPQQRRRVYIVGYLDQRLSGKIFPLETGNGASLKQIVPGKQAQRVYATDGTSTCLTSQGGGWGAKTGLYFIDMNPEKYGNLIRAFEESEFEKKAFDLDAINLRPSLKDRICVKGSCAKCRFAGECKYQQYLRRARAMGNVDFQVTNHNLYLTSQKMKTDNGDENGILLSSDLIVVDEAHKLKETAEEVFGVRLNRSDIPKYVSAVKLLCKDGQSRTEYRSNLYTLLNLCEMLFSSLGKRATSEDSEDGRGTLIELSLSEQEGLRQMDDIIARVESARKRNRNGFDGNGKVIRDTLKEFRRTNNINVWIEEDENGEMTLCATPRDIASKLRSALWDKPCSHLLTSGTVSDGTDFSFFLKENGLDRIPNSRMAVSSTPSPFDYENHTRLYIPKGIPAPDNNDGDYIQAIAEHVVDLVRATNGHTAILFTSYKVLSAVYGLTKDRLSDYDVICMTRSNKTAIGNFKKSKNGVLFASGSMWEGVDCIGDCLSSVIIVRLPFPLRSAMMEKKKQEIGDVRAFIQDYAVPEMLIKLRQGIGRLIRSETDTGLITILDPRVRSKAYAARIENILGKYPEAESLEEVREFFLQVKPSTYFEV